MPPPSGLPSASSSARSSHAQADPPRHPETRPHGSPRTTALRAVDPVFQRARAAVAKAIWDERHAQKGTPPSAAFPKASAGEPRRSNAAPTAQLTGSRAKMASQCALRARQRSLSANATGVTDAREGHPRTSSRPCRTCSPVPPRTEVSVTNAVGRRSSSRTSRGLRIRREERRACAATIALAPSLRCSAVGR